MKLFQAEEIDYPAVVDVLRPSGTYDSGGNYGEQFSTVITGMTADIQLSLKIRNLVTENTTGESDNTVWIMYAEPPVPIIAGDRVTDGARTYSVDETAVWGTHVECYMKVIQ